MDGANDVVHQPERPMTAASIMERRTSTSIPYETELSTFRQSLSRAPDTQNEVTEFSLPPTDQGKDAWLVLAANFFIEALVWGLPFTFGVFQEYYSSLPQFQDERSRVAIIGTIAVGIMYLGSPISLLCLRQWPQHRRKSSLIGIVIITLSLVAASFANAIWQLILTQGVLFAVGASMLYYPVLLFLDEWFVRKKGLAFGIAWAGTGFSGLAFPFLISWSLQHYSFRTTLRIMAVVYVTIATPALAVVKPRLPVSAVSARGLPDLHFAIKRPFFACQVGNILQGLGNFIPALFLPTYARHLGYSGGVATATVVLLNSGQFIGSLTVGFFVDRWRVTHLALLITIASTLSVLLLWGLTNSAPVLCIFALCYGLTAGSFSSLWPGMVQEAKRRDYQVEAGLAYAVLVAGRGIGSVISGPFSDLLLRSGPVAHSFTYGYGSRYGLVILYAGICNALGSVIFIARRVGV